MIQQLELLQTNSIKTSESNVRLANKEEDILHIEIKRSLARWNCLRLVLKGRSEDYHQLTAQALLCLFAEITQLRHNPGYDVYGNYLQKRAQQLGIKSHYLAHLAASMRLYTLSEGKELQRWFDALPQATQRPKI